MNLEEKKGRWRGAAGGVSPLSFGCPEETESDDWMRDNKDLPEEVDRWSRFLAQLDAIFLLLLQSEDLCSLNLKYFTRSK